MSQRSAYSAYSGYSGGAYSQRGSAYGGGSAGKENRADGEEDSIYLSGSSRQPSLGPPISKRGDGSDAPSEYSRGGYDSQRDPYYYGDDPYGKDGDAASGGGGGDGGGGGGDDGGGDYGYSGYDYGDGYDYSGGGYGSNRSGGKPPRSDGGDYSNEPPASDGYSGGAYGDGYGYGDDGYGDGYSNYGDDYGDDPYYGDGYDDPYYDDKYGDKYDQYEGSYQSGADGGAGSALGGVDGYSQASSSLGNDSSRPLATAAAESGAAAGRGLGGAAHGGGGAVDGAAEDEDDGTYVGLGIQLQEPTDGDATSGFVVTKLVRGAPGDRCGLILEGDVLVAVDGRSIGALRFSEVSELLAGPEGVPILLQFERIVRDGAGGIAGAGGAAQVAHTRTYDAALKRERFYLPEDDEAGDDAYDDDDDDASFASGGGRGRKAGYWEGYRAAMAHKAPPFSTAIATFESDDDDALDDDLSDRPDGAMPRLPASPDPSDLSDDASEVEATTEQHLSGALAAGATVGLAAPPPGGGGGGGRALPTLEQIHAQAAEEDAHAREELLGLSATAQQWAEKTAAWDASLTRDLEGTVVMSQLIDMWKLKLVRVRSKLGVDAKAVAAQEKQLQDAPLPPPQHLAPSRPADLARAALESGKDGSAEMLAEMQRYMVEAERWRAETKRLSVQLRKARDEVGRRGKEAQTMRAQNVTWASDNKARREQASRAKAEAEELRKANESVVAQAATLEERVAKLQDEVTLKSELEAMWRRAAERGGAGAGGDGGGEAGAAAVTWKLEAEKAAREGERWKAVARRAEEAMRARDEEVLRMRMQLEDAQRDVQRAQVTRHLERRDEAPLEEMRSALTGAQDDLSSKIEEAAMLNAKVARLESALRQLM